MKTTRYFKATRTRPDRIGIKPEWIDQAIHSPDYMMTQADGRIRIWKKVAGTDRYLRVVLLEDGVTLHNAFLDRTFKP